MKKIYLISTILFTLLFFSSCGHFSNGDPVGVTGGGTGGYGENTNEFQPVNLANLLITGEWKRTSGNYSYLWSFESDGEFIYTSFYYDDINYYQYGTFEITQNDDGYDRLDFYFSEYNEHSVYYFEIRNNSLYMYYNPYGDLYRIYEKVED